QHVPPAALPPAQERRKKGGGFWWIIIILLLILLWFLFGRGCSGNDSALTDSTDADTIGMTMDTEPSLSMDSSMGAVNARESIMVSLPNGETIDAYKGGIEDQLVIFLNSDYESLSEDELKNKWFDFDNLNFQTGTSTILPESQVQIDNLAAILEAFPDAKVKIGGYTDKTGTEEINKKLSNDRAAAVQIALEPKGVGDRVIETEGYGSDFAEFSPDAPESDRVKDRRVAISIRK
ncbi:MAG: OmpA family protein, partial [Sphingobacterium sp.]